MCCADSFEWENNQQINEVLKTEPLSMTKCSKHIVQEAENAETAGRPASRQISHNSH
jgi:hypothetical protein